MHRDLTGNNLVAVLLKRRRELKKIFDEFDRARYEWKEINNTLKEIMGDAASATVNGGRLEIRVQKRKEYVIPAQEWRVLYVKWDETDDDE